MQWCLYFIYVILSLLFVFVFFCKQNTSYEMRISDWSSDVCSSDLSPASPLAATGGRSHLGVRQWPPMAMLETPWRFESSQPHHAPFRTGQPRGPITASAPASRTSTFRDDEDPDPGLLHTAAARRVYARHGTRSEEHTSELQSLMRRSYSVFCLKNKPI